MSLTAKLITTAQERGYVFVGTFEGGYTFRNEDTQRGFVAQFNEESVIVREFDLSTNKTTLIHEIQNDNWADDTLNLIATL